MKFITVIETKPGQRARLQAEVDFMAMGKTEIIDGKPDLPIGFFFFFGFLRQDLVFEKPKTTTKKPQKTKQKNHTKENKTNKKPQ